MSSATLSIVAGSLTLAVFRIPTGVRAWIERYTPGGPASVVR